jgi:hypothetical protein
LLRAIEGHLAARDNIVDDRADNPSTSVAFIVGTVVTTEMLQGKDELGGGLYGTVCPLPASTQPLDLVGTHHESSVCALAAGTITSNAAHIEAVCFIVVPPRPVSGRRSQRD